MSEFYIGMADILEVDEADIGPDFELGKSWDSLAIVSTIALIDEVFGATVSVSRLQECTTVGEVESLAQQES